MPTMPGSSATFPNARKNTSVPTLAVTPSGGTSLAGRTTQRKKTTFGMSTRPDCVTAVIELRLVVPGSPSLPVTADVSFDHRDPYAVRVAFHTGASDVVEWTFARTLLTDGVTRAVGEG